MEIAPEVRELEALAETAQVPMSRVLAKAGVASSTYWRWRHEGKDPQSKTLRKLKAALQELAAA